MRVMVLVKASEDSERGEMPSTELKAMGKFNEGLVNAGLLLAGEGLKPSSEGKRVAFDGPAARSSTFRNLRIGGRFLDMAEAIEWVTRCPNPMPGPSEIEIRPVFEVEDFGENMTPELRMQEDRLREEVDGL